MVNSHSFFSNYINDIELQIERVKLQITEKTKYIKTLQDYIEQEALPAIAKLNRVYCRSKQQTFDLKQWKINLNVTKQEIDTCKNLLSQLAKTKEDLIIRRDEIREKMLNQRNNLTHVLASAAA